MRERSSRRGGEGAVDPSFAELAKAFASKPGVTVGKMMGSHGLRWNGNIFAMLVRGRWVMKLPRERVDALVETGRGERFDPRHDGRKMKEWIVLAGFDGSLELAREAHRFAKESAGRKTVSGARRTRRT